MSVWDKVKLALRVLWASPVTIVTFLFYIGPVWAMRWYSYHGVVGGKALCWTVNLDKGPAWLHDYWMKWGGHCVGSTVVVKYVPGTSQKADVTLTHELVHVDQMHLMGPLQPFLYLLSSVCAMVAGEDRYRCNVFEMAARRRAGQIVDGQSFVLGYTSARK